MLRESDERLRIREMDNFRVKQKDEIAESGREIEESSEIFLEIGNPPPIIVENDEYIGDGFVTDSGNSGRISYRLTFS